MQHFGTLLTFGVTPSASNLPPGWDTGPARFFRRQAALLAYHRRLKEKYELAAARPFLPVAPDPPAPE